MRAFFLSGPPVNLQQLRAVRETIRAGFSLTQAARAIGTSQPALSRAILELEGELGVPVFLRHGKRILGLTDPGRGIADRAERVLAEIEGIERASAEWRSRDAGELRVATTHTQARYALPPVVQAFRRRYPAVRLSLLQGNPRQITRSVLEREVDLAIATEVGQEVRGTGATDPALLRDLLLFETVPWEHVVVVPARHPLAGRPLRLDELARQPLITYVEEFSGRRRIDRAFADAGLAPDVVIAAIDSDIIKTYVALGLGVGIIAGLAFDPKRDRGLVGMPAGTLFGMNATRVAVRRDVLLRGYARTFIELFAPDVAARLAEQLPP